MVRIIFIFKGGKNKMDGFDKIFGSQMEDESEFDTIFGAQDDGDLVDIACGFTEAGECETDFDELHQTDDDADIEDLENEVVGDETDNAPDGAEGTDEDPAIDLAMGEGCNGTECPVFKDIHNDDYAATPDDFVDLAGDETDNTPDMAEGHDEDPAIDLAMGECGDDLSADGKPISQSDAQYGGDFYPDDIRDEEEQDALTGEGRDVNMDEKDIDGEFDKMMESAFGEDAQTDGIDYEDDGLVGDVGTLDAKDDSTTLGESEDMDAMMASLGADDDDEAIDGIDDECGVKEATADDDDDYEAGDADLVDLVSGD